jgi:hypothetical protein
MSYISKKGLLDMRFLHDKARILSGMTIAYEKSNSTL